MKKVMRKGKYIYSTVLYLTKKKDLCVSGRVQFQLVLFKGQLYKKLPVNCEEVHGFVVKTHVKNMVSAIIDRSIEGHWEHLGHLGEYLH